jgi:peptidoglycan hydrolase CwlO-like protein
MRTAMFIIGMLFGVMLSVTLALFCILSMGGNFVENAKAALTEARQWLTGKRRQAGASGTAPGAPPDGRLRALQDENRLMQRLMQQARDEQGEIDARHKAAVAELEAMCAVVSERERKIIELDEQARTERARALKLQDSLAQRGSELADARREVKDLQTELSVLQSDAGTKAFTLPQ